uniref:ribonuclease H n=1 Tax=Sinocyclocheilus anshuiensis TaxID=1608454 RepID=A0A671PS10_9TELE
VNLGGCLVNILIDTGAACPCTNILLPLSTQTIQIKGIGDTLMTATQTQPVQLDLGMVVLNEPFWYLPDNSEGTVLGMDIMRKHGFVIHCFEKQIEVQTNKPAKKCMPRSHVSIMSISSTEPIQLLINKHSDVWANHEHDCGLTDFEVCIEGEPPPPQKQYRITPEAEAAVHEIVKHSTTNSPCLPVPKPNGKWRLCIDYQRLNKVLPKATPIVANPSTILSQVSTNASWFTVLDIKNGFWSIKVKREDQWKLAFTVNEIPAIFHRAVADVLTPLLGTGKVVHYVDDILIATEGPLENHLQLVDELIQMLSDAGFKMNKEKPLFIWRGNRLYGSMAITKFPHIRRNAYKAFQHYNCNLASYTSTRNPHFRRKSVCAHQQKSGCA